jgi:dTDP-L-rhamnose 4-epimerase
MVDVVLPALNERAALPDVLASIPYGFRPIVVDNGSTDGTGSVARALGAEVVVEPRRGFGAACFAGLCATRSELVCFMDCDASLDGADLLRVCGAVADGRADLVLGARRAEDRRAWPWHARVANGVLGCAVSRRTGAVLSDLGPMRAARRVALLDLGITDRRFGWPLEMVVRGARAGWRIREVPVAYRRRVGRSKVTGTVRGTALTVFDMARALAA